MATVHLIWWGRFKDVDTCVATANAVAQEAMGHTVQLWIRGEETAQFRKAGIHSRLKLIGIRTFLQLAQSRQDATRDPLFKQAVEVLQVLDRHQCYAAVKDLMNLILLYVHGGLCMDTTTQLLGLNEVSTHRGTRLKSALDHIGTGFKIPHISTEEWMHQPLLMTDINILQGRNYEFDGAMESLVSVPAVDVWLCMHHRGKRSSRRPWRVMYLGQTGSASIEQDSPTTVPQTYCGRQETASE